jgi:hypothetical protein
MNTRTKVIAGLCAIGTAWFAQAQDPSLGIKVPAGTNQRFETIHTDSSFPAWRRFYLDPAAHVADAPIGYASVSDALTQATTSGVFQALSENLTSLLETSYTTGLQGMPERSVLGQVGTQFGSGWGVQAGVRHSEIGLRAVEQAPGVTDWQTPRIGAAASANLGMLTFERYWDRYRGAYTFFSGRTDTGSLATGHRVQLHYFYSERSSVGLAYTTGRPFDPAMGFGNTVATEVNNLGVTGEHWISPTWAINYNAGVNYNVLTPESNVSGLKPELRLGLRLRF